MSSNPFTDRLKAAAAKLSRLEAMRDNLNKNAIPGTFITGRSGVSQARLKQLARQLDKTIDLAKSITETRKDVGYLERQKEAYDKGKINAQGRSISPKRAKKKRPRSEEGKIMAKAMLALSLDGEYTLLERYKVEVFHNWDEETRELDGIIRVTDLQENKQTDHLAKSPQGVHLEETQASLIRDILATAKKEIT